VTTEHPTPVEKHRVERAPPPAAFEVDFDVARVERTLPSVAFDVDLVVDFDCDFALSTR